MREIVFNELSLCNDYTSTKSIDFAREKFDVFVSLVNTLKKGEVFEDWFISSDICSMCLEENYTVADWLKDNNVSGNHRQFFRSFLDKARYINQDSVDGEFSIEYQGIEHSCLGLTFIKEFSEKPCALSVLMDVFWDKDTLQGKYRKLNMYGDIDEWECTISNITEKTNLRELIREQSDRAFSSISSGQDLWEHREELFPNLIFCESVKKQLYEDSERYHVIRVMLRLKKMQEYFSEEHEEYDPKEMGLNARTESETVKTDNDLKNKRLFTLPSGKTEYFYDHISFSGKYSDGRIHFLPDVRNMCCYIGYIGRHLRTKKF